MDTKEEKQNKTPSKRKYPLLYEKLIPIAIGIIVLAMIILLLVIVGVISGFFSSAGYSPDWF